MSISIASNKHERRDGAGEKTLWNTFVYCIIIGLVAIAHAAASCETSSMIGPSFPAVAPAGAVD